MPDSTLTAAPLSKHHARIVFDHLCDPALYAFIPGEPPPDLAQLEREFERLSRGSTRADQTWLNWLASRDGQPVATLQATLFRAAPARIGYVVFRSFWGRGVGTQAVRWLVRELFENHGVARIHAFVDRRNLRSLRVLRSIGFTTLADHEQPLDVPDTDFALELTADRRP